MPKIIFQRKKCIGCGYCEEMVPSRWQMNINDGKSNLLEATQKRDIHTAIIDFDELDINTEVAQACPVKVIRVEV